MVIIFTFYQWFIVAIIVRYIRSYSLNGILLEVHALIGTGLRP